MQLTADTQNKVFQFCCSAIEQMQKPLTEQELAALLLLHSGDFELLAALGYPQTTTVTLESFDAMLDDLAQKIGDTLRAAANSCDEPDEPAATSGTGRSKRLSPESRALLLQKLAAGAAPVDLAAEFDVTPATVYFYRNKLRALRSGDPEEPPK